MGTMVQVLAAVKVSIQSNCTNKGEHNSISAALNQIAVLRMILGNALSLMHAAIKFCNAPPTTAAAALILL